MAYTDRADIEGGLTDIRRMTVVLVSLFFAAMMIIQTTAVNSDGGMIKYTDESGFEFSNGDDDLFGCFSGLMPGDTASGTVTIKNAGSGPAVFYLKADTKNLFDRMAGFVSVNMSLTKKNDKKSLGNLLKKTSKNICLGTFDKGEEAVLRVEISVDKKAGNELSDAAELLRWVFTAEESGTPTNTEKNDDVNISEGTENGEYNYDGYIFPDTGSRGTAVMTGCAVLAMITQGVVVVCMHRKRKKKNAE